MPTNRREALKTLATATVLAASLGRINLNAQTSAPAAPVPGAPAGPFTLPPLPYAYEALEPHIDAETMHLHHDKHHAAYVAKLNEAVGRINQQRAASKSPLPLITAETKVDDLLKDLASLGAAPADTTAVRNQGGGHSNHSLFWQTLIPKGGGEPTGGLAKAIITELGGLDNLKKEMTKAGTTLFGSGWVWLVLDGSEKLYILTLPNQDSPLSDGHYPLFGIDVWEHAYYLKYHNVRADYLTAIWNVVNWGYISDRYTAAMTA
jgi:Fe-Mn family superoxide dismutase